MALPNWVRSANRGNKDKMVELATQDLAERMGENPDSGLITLKEVVPVTWQDMTMGYPQMGRKAAPGLIPGYQITLVYNSREYDYHSGFGRVVYVPAGKGLPALPADEI